MKEQTATLLKVFVTATGGFFGYFLGRWDGLLQTLIIFSCIDYVSGMIAVYVLGELKSKIGFKGIAKKVMLFLLVTVAARVDLAIESNSMFREAVIFSFLGNVNFSALLKT